MNLFESLNITATPETPHSITLIANNGEQKVYGRLTDDQMKQFVELFLKLGVTPTVEQKTRATMSEQSKTAPAPKKSAPKKSYKASSPKKEEVFYSYVENAPLTGSVKLADYVSIQASKSGKQAVIEVSKELAPCWWYWVKSFVAGYNTLLDDLEEEFDPDYNNLFPLKVMSGKGIRKIVCDRKAVNEGAAFMFADSAQSMKSMKKLMGMIEEHLTKTGKTSVKKCAKMYADYDGVRRSQWELSHKK